MLIRSQNKKVLVAFEFLPDIEVSGGVISARRDSGYGYREYLAPEKLQENQQRKIYPDEPEGLLRIQTQDRRCTV